jgi:hypothetical protein
MLIYKELPARRSTGQAGQAYTRNDYTRSDIMDVCS